MKKSITLIGILSAFLLAINMTSCNGTLTPRSPRTSRLVLDSTAQYYGQNYKVYTLEGCEYIVTGIGNNRWGSHKGNCKNPIHQGHTDRLDIEDKDYVDPTEKHFDCVVNEVITPDRRSQPPYAYVTECGILFYSDAKHKVGDTLKDFQSPKHK